MSNSVVLWICVGVVLLAIAGLAGLVLDAAGHAKRLRAAIGNVQVQMRPQLESLRSSLTSAPGRSGLVSDELTATPALAPIRSGGQNEVHSNT